MHKITRYVLGKMVVNTSIILLAISLLLLVIQATKFLDLIIGRGMPIKYLFYISMLSMPTAWNEVLPLGVFIAIIFSFQTMANNNELVIMQANGLSPIQLVKPAVLIGLIVAFFCFLFSLFIINYSFVTYLKLKNQLTNDFSIKVIDANKFIQLTPEITIYVGSSSKQGRLRNVLINSDKPLTEDTIYASTATIIKDKHALKVLLQKGSLQKLDKSTNSTTFVNFEFYVLTINQNSKPLNIVRDTSRKMFLWELVFYKNLPFMKSLQSNPKMYQNKAISFMIEFNKRLINIVLSIALSIIVAYFFVTARFQRNTKYMAALKSIVVGLALKIFCTTVVISATHLYMIVFWYLLIIVFIGWLVVKLVKLSANN